MQLVTILPSLAAIVAISVMISAYAATSRTARQVKLKIDKDRRDRH